MVPDDLLDQVDELFGSGPVGDWNECRHITFQMVGYPCSGAVSIIAIEILVFQVQVPQYIDNQVVFFI